MSGIRLLAVAAGAALVAAGCGGGGGGSAASGSETTTVASASQLVGTAATGAALASASVAITDSTGTSACEESAITTTAAGTYSCTLKAGRSAPFFVVVTDPTGNNTALVGVATDTPAAGTSATVNATHLTTAIVGQLAGGNALDVGSNGSVDAVALRAITGNVVDQLRPVLTSIGAPSDYDPFRSSITAATTESAGNAADMVLDLVKVVIDPATGQPALVTVDSSTPVVLATASAAGAALSAPDAALQPLMLGVQIVAQSFNNCFSVPVAQRVLAVNTGIPFSQGGPRVTSFGDACNDIVSRASNAGTVEFMQSGFDAGQFIYGSLNSESMTGMKYSVPELMAFYPSVGTATAPAIEAYDRAVVNLKFIDAAGNPGNMISMVARIPGSSSSARPTEWWLVGDQLPVQALPQALIRRTEQLNPANVTKFSTFQTGIRFSFNSKGPGSTLGADSLAFVRVSGPGLPGNGAVGTGLVYKTSSQTNLSSMELFNKTGSLSTGSQCGNGTTFNCPNLWLSRTRGLTGADANTLAANPNDTPQTLATWAQPGDGFDATKFVRGARYKMEFFYGTNTTIPDRTIYRALLTDLTPATVAVNLPWNTPGPNWLAAMDPNGSLAGAQTGLLVDWLQNLAAPQVADVRPMTDLATGSFGAFTPVSRGATSVTLHTTVPAFNAGTQRAILMGYRTLDWSSKTAMYTWN